MKKILVFKNDRNEVRRKLPVEIVLDNIRSAYNVGSIIRSCDALGCRKIHFLGITPYVNNEKVLKTSKGAENFIETQQWLDKVELLNHLKQEGFYIYSLELTNKSKEINTVELKFPCVWILGHEIVGVSEVFLENSNEIVEIPMLGIKNSLNVSVATGIVLYETYSQYMRK